MYLFIYFFTQFQTDEVYLEVQVQNIMSTPITLEKFILEPSIGYEGNNCILYSKQLLNILVLLLHLMYLIYGMIS